MNSGTTTSTKKKKKRTASRKSKTGLSEKTANRLTIAIENLTNSIIAVTGIGASNSNNNTVVSESASNDTKDDINTDSSKGENAGIDIGPFYSIVTLEIARELFEFAEEAARQCITIIAIVQAAYDAILVAKHGYPPCNLSKARYDNHKLDHIRKSFESFFEGKDRVYKAMAKNYVIKLSDMAKRENKIINEPSPWALERYNRKYGENNTLSETLYDARLSYSEDGYHTNFIAKDSKIESKEYIPVDFVDLTGKTITCPISYKGHINDSGKFIFDGKGDISGYTHGFKEAG